MTPAHAALLAQADSLQTAVKGADREGRYHEATILRARRDAALQEATRVRIAFAAGFTAAIRLFWQGVCESKAAEAERYAWPHLKNARECRAVKPASRDYAEVIGTMVGYDERVARECLEEAAQYRAWAGEA